MYDQSHWHCTRRRLPDCGLQPVGNVAGQFLVQANRLLTNRTVELRGPLYRLFGSLCASNDLDQRNQMWRIEGMRDDTAFRMCGRSFLYLAHDEPDELEAMIASAGSSPSSWP
jgi:hypothetical protein